VVGGAALAASAWADDDTASGWEGGRGKDTCTGRLLADEIGIVKTLKLLLSTMLTSGMSQKYAG